ncbi:MAG: polyphosphate kinase 2 family protein [Candidatus Eisenbacteria bacterium]
MTKSANSRLAERYRVKKANAFRLKKIDPNDRAGLESEEKAAERLAEGVLRLADLQSRLYAEHKRSVLVVIQAMDAAGKDSAIKHVMSGINPQGVMVTSFKQPSAEELDHDFLWRCNQRLPAAGHIGIFNRSYYEEVLVVRVHPEYLEAQHLPEELVGKNVWKHRFEDIRNWERHLVRNGVVIRKFFLYVSRAEQKRRFLSRLDEPEKNWKFSEADVKERAHWKQYMRAYEDMIQNTSTDEAPWYVVPADHKWFTRLVVAEALIHSMESLDLEYPRVDKKRKRELSAARRELIENG